MEPIPAVVELAIYCYFVVVAALGCYLHGRLWFGSGDGAGDSDDGTDSESATGTDGTAKPN